MAGRKTGTRHVGRGRRRRRRRVLRLPLQCRCAPGHSARSPSLAQDHLPPRRPAPTPTSSACSQPRTRSRRAKRHAGDEPRTAMATTTFQAAPPPCDLAMPRPRLRLLRAAGGRAPRRCRRFRAPRAHGPRPLRLPSLWEPLGTRRLRRHLTRPRRALGGSTSWSTRLTEPAAWPSLAMPPSRSRAPAGPPACCAAPSSSSSPSLMSPRSWHSTIRPPPVLGCALAVLPQGGRRHSPATVV
ncbi:hypothetical protein PVAP13_3KG382427 [Panicum virgatum]|uniref:Uncharacterized protein n=1 Tax=Panicum virgatum TaxID=38727 RepID=A0A8T0V1U8_PANVG|nr:hypothetical protein PVAP13_3KG382427 [Panicum virgatum]